jgi:GT2 family glycosyltransferase
MEPQEKTNLLDLSEAIPAADAPDNGVAEPKGSKNPQPEDMLSAMVSAMARANREMREELRNEFLQGLAALRAEVKSALDAMEERLSIEDCRILATVAEKRMDQDAKLAHQEERLASKADLDRLRDHLNAAINAEGARFKETLAALAEQLSNANRSWSRELADLIKPFALVSEEELARPDDGGLIACCDYPGAGRIKAARRTLTVCGWAVSRSGIRSVETLVDGIPHGRVSYGALRQDVAMIHPSFPDAEHSGFVGTVVVTGLEDGLHELTVLVTAEDGQQREIKARFEVRKAAATGGESPNTHAEYQEWLAKHETTAADLTVAAGELTRLTYQPTISLVVPVYNTPASLLQAMVDSVRAQVYGNWELCLADDASTADHVKPFLTRLMAEEPRVKVVLLRENRGIAGASNAALALATGEFVGLVDHDDLLAPLALYEVVRFLNEEPGTDLIYTDEDKVAESGRFRFDPFFKPDWSPDLLLSGNYVNHFGVYRRSLVEEIGGFRPEYDGSQDYDLVLRFTERTNRIRHLANVLYTWRVATGSTAATETAKPHTLDAARRALADALQRRQLPGRVEPGFFTSRWRVRYDLRDRPAVTLLIPTGGKLKYLETCLESVLTESSYSPFEVLVVDNSEGKDVAGLCASLQARYTNLHCRSYGLKPFNYSALNNFGMHFVKTPYVVFLNDDITVIAHDWIEAMLEHAQRPEVGVVGAKLLFPDDTIQHAGVVLGPHENSAHAFKHFPREDSGYYYLPQIIRNTSAVTFACAMMRVSVYREAGGLDEINLPVAFNDVDLCLRVRECGYWIVYTPYAELYHHESVTKTMMLAPGELEYMKRRWGHVIRRDPFYNPHLTRTGEDYALKLE